MNIHGSETKWKTCNKKLLIVRFQMLKQQILDDEELFEPF